MEPLKLTLDRNCIIALERYARGRTRAKHGKEQNDRQKREETNAIAVRRLADTLYIWTNEEALPQLQRLIEEHWQASEIEVLLPEDIELINANLSDAHNRVLFVWWD